MFKNLFFPLLVISLFVFTQISYAQDATSPTPSSDTSPSPSVSSSPSVTPTTKAKSQSKQASQSATIKYVLAYPGMLPDNPLYKLKVLRDKIILYFTTDPQQKINFYLLQTDKGIQASSMLVDKGETALAVQTALKAENNYTNLANEMGNLPRKPDKAFFDKLYTAAKKHQEVLQKMSEKVKGDDKRMFQNVIEFSQRNQQSIKYYQEQI